jgi:hypothetical protein
MRAQVFAIACCLLSALGATSNAAEYVFAFELREYQGALAHETVVPVFGAKLVDVETIWNKLGKMNYTTLAQVEVQVAPRARHEQRTRLGNQLFDVTIQTGDIGNGREPTAVKLRYRDEQRASELSDSRYYGIFNKPFFLQSETARLPQGQSDATHLWIATLKKAGAQNDAAKASAPVR